MDDPGLHVRTHADLRALLVDRLLERGDEVRAALVRTPRWRLLRRHVLTNEVIAIAAELQSIEQGIIIVAGHVAAHMRELGLVK